jgi:hypothetical protein
VNGMFPFLAAELFQFQAIRPASLLLSAVVPRPAGGAFQPDVFTHRG